MHLIWNLNFAKVLEFMECLNSMMFVSLEFQRSSYLVDSCDKVIHTLGESALILKLNLFPGSKSCNS